MGSSGICLATKVRKLVGLLTPVSDVIWNEELIPGAYAFTYGVSVVGGVVGIFWLWDQIIVPGIIKGDGIDSSYGAFFVPVSDPSSAIPVLDKLYPTFLKR